jgi:hypothetical protein
LRRRATALLDLGHDVLMDDADITLRNVTYGQLVHLGRAPTPGEVAVAAGMAVDDVVQGWQRLHDAHALVLDAATGGLRMANPFSAVPTPHRAWASGRWWYANCAWDAFGICAALHVDGRIESTCPDCGEVIEVAVRGGHPDDERLVFHCLVPAAHWWDDIVFT